jgi:RNA polymerase sigma factor (sigma-70 family)
MFKKMTDSELILHWRECNDARALGELFSRYSHLVLGVCLKYFKNKPQAEDAVMDIFEKIHADLKKHKIEYFKSWLYMVAKNHCLMLLRKNGLQITDNEFVTHENSLHFSESPKDDDETEQQNASLDLCMKKLRMEQKYCIELFFLQEKSYKEVSDLTGFDFNAVKSHIQNAKVNLKKCMDATG